MSRRSTSQRAACRPASTRNARLFSTAILVVAAWFTPAAAQTSGLEAMLKRFDTNRNGQLDATEVPSQYRTLINRAATQAGLDTNRPISIDRLIRATQSQGNEEDDRGRDRREWGRGDWGRGRDDRDRDRERDRDRDRDRDRRDGDRSAATMALVPGFGPDPNDPDAALVPGFGAPGDATAAIPLEERYDERVLRNVDREILREYDRNRNGMIDADEWREVPWGDDPRQDDKNRDGRLSREELAARIARRWGFGERRPGGDSRDGQSDRDRERDRSRDDRSRDDRSRDGGGEDEEAKTRRYATGFVQSYDKNKDGFLTPDEWRGARTDVQAADRNRDNRVDANELTAHWLEANRRRQEGRGRDGDRSSRDGEPNGGTYRFDTAHERLPRGTPPWFIEKDANEDGQVSMAEYSTTWNDATVAEFAKYDGNDDGIITPHEALNPRADAPPAGATASSGNSLSAGSSTPSGGSSSGYPSSRSPRISEDRDSRSDRGGDRGRGRRSGGFFRGG